MKASNHLAELEERYPVLAGCIPSVAAAAALLVECYDEQGCVFACGNGGSCADADHITGELLKGFCRRRPILPQQQAALESTAPAEDAALLAPRLQRGLRAVSLQHFPAAGSAVANDLDPSMGPAQLLFALGRPGDVFIGISTSGNAKNVRYALDVARMIGMKVIGLTGEGGGFLGEHADVAIKVPEKETYKIQELHLPVYHTLCRMVEDHYFQE